MVYSLESQDARKRADSKSFGRPLRRVLRCVLGTVVFFMPVVILTASNVALPSIEDAMAGLPPIAEFTMAKSQDKSASAAAQRAPVRLFNGTEGCSLSLSNITFLGSGDRGHTFSTFMTCPRGDKELVAFKVAKRWDTGPVMYISSSNVEKKRALYERILANSTNEKNKNFFSIQLGTVDVPRDMLYDGMNQANERVSRKVVNVTDDAEANSLLVADIFTASSGMELGTLLRTREEAVPPVRRQIAKDLVYIYRHLFHHNVLHCDVRMNHILYSVADNQTMLIDFEEFRFYEETEEKYQIIVQEAQLWQLFALLGNACSHVGRGLDFAFDVPWGGCNPRTKNRTDVMQRLIPALEECGFDGPMVWRDETGTNMAQTYQDLARWCGLL